MKPVNADMMNRVRHTAKWSQLYKSGPSFPPKHKVLFINQEEDVNQTAQQVTEEDTNQGFNNDLSKMDQTANRNAGDDLGTPQLNEIMSNGTQKHHARESDFDEMGKILGD